MVLLELKFEMSRIQDTRRINWYSIFFVFGNFIIFFFGGVNLSFFLLVINFCVDTFHYL